MKEPEIKIYNKVTVGYVVQIFKWNNKNKYRCIRQLFVTGDDVPSYENDVGEKVTISHILDKEDPYPFEMEQPTNNSTPTPKEKLELALAIMQEKQIEQYKRGVNLLERGVKIDDMPGDIFTG